MHEIVVLARDLDLDRRKLELDQRLEWHQSHVVERLETALKAARRRITFSGHAVESR